MNKKSAIATAGGLVTSFAAGVAAVTFNWGLGSSTAATTSAAAAPSASPAAKVKPIIKHRTITIHKKAPAPKPSASAPAQTITLASNPVYSHAVAPVTHTSGSAAGGGESEGGDRGEGGDD